MAHAKRSLPSIVSLHTRNPKSSPTTLQLAAFTYNQVWCESVSLNFGEIVPRCGRLFSIADKRKQSPLRWLRHKLASTTPVAFSIAKLTVGHNNVRKPGQYRPAVQRLRQWRLAGAVTGEDLKHKEQIRTLVC